MSSAYLRLLIFLSHVQFFVTPWTVACQAPVSIEFPGNNTGVGCLFLLQGIFPIQQLNPCLLHLLHSQADSLPLCHQGIILLIFIIIMLLAFIPSVTYFEVSDLRRLIILKVLQNGNLMKSYLTNRAIIFTKWVLYILMIYM